MAALSLTVELVDPTFRSLHLARPREPASWTVRRHTGTEETASAAASELLKSFPPGRTFISVAQEADGQHRFVAMPRSFEAAAPLPYISEAEVKLFPGAHRLYARAPCAGADAAGAALAWVKDDLAPHGWGSNYSVVPWVSVGREARLLLSDESTLTRTLPAEKILGHVTLVVNCHEARPRRASPRAGSSHASRVPRPSDRRKRRRPSTRWARRASSRSSRTRCTTGGAREPRQPSSTTTRYSAPSGATCAAAARSLCTASRGSTAPRASSRVTSSTATTHSVTPRFPRTPPTSTRSSSQCAGMLPRGYLAPVPIARDRRCARTSPRHTSTCSETTKPTCASGAAPTRDHRATLGPIYAQSVAAGARHQRLAPESHRHATATHPISMFIFRLASESRPVPTADYAVSVRSQ